MHPRLSALCLAATALHAGPYRNELLPATRSQSATSIATAGGLLWIAYPDGVFRCDGSGLVQYPGQRNVRFLAVDSAQRLWAAGPAGLARLDSGQWTVIRPDSIDAMVASPAGIWARGAALELFPPSGEPRQFPNAHPLGELTADPAGAIHFTCPAGLCSLQPPDWRLESRPNPLRGEWRKVVPDGPGRYWIASSQAIALIENGVPGKPHRARHGPQYSPSGRAHPTTAFPARRCRHLF